MCHVKVIQKTDDLQDLDEDEYCKYLHDTMSCYHTVRLREMKTR